MPDVRRSQERLGNLPGIQHSYVADTTAPARAMIQVGRDLQNNQAFAAAGSIFEQKERRNVEDAYMRLQAANNAHLNGGAFTLTGDPLDTEEGGGYLTKRGRNADGSDEEYRETMSKTADRLTAKMNANERMQFQKLYSHTTEQGLAALRRNTEQEMLRYKSELADATLQSAAAANLSTAINAFTQQQAFNNGAIDMAQRQALSTDDARSYDGARLAIATQSRQQAVDVFTGWHNATTMEFDRAADFMRSQGMDEKTITWRKQEFFKSQGVALTRALSAKAQTAEKESNAAEWLTMAAKAAEVTLPPALQADALSGLESIKGQRLQALLGLARNERNLDKQEQLVAIAETAAQNFNAGGELLGAVAAKADGIRSHALKLETEFAYEALATGKTYDPRDNARMQAALKDAKPLFEKHQRAELSRTLTEQGEFIGNMVKSGFGFDRDGNVVARSVDERRSILRTHLAKGDLRGKKYMELTADLDKIEQSGKKPLFERVSADVCAALGKEIKTAWKDSQTLLDEKEDPASKVGSYSFSETVTMLRPEMEIINPGGIPRGASFGIPTMSLYDTGKLVEKQSVIQQKRDILARDVPKMIDLLMAAESANGLMVDLDDNPKTPSVKMDARAYKASLLADIKKRVLAVDLDKQARGIFAAAALKERERKALEAAALTLNANLRLPAAATSTDEPNTEDSYDY